MLLDLSSQLDASGTGHKMGKGFTKDVKNDDDDGEIQGASYAGEGGKGPTSKDHHIRYYGTYQGKLSIEYTELISYLVNPMLSNDLT